MARVREDDLLDSRERAGGPSPVISRRRRALAIGSLVLVAATVITVVLLVGHRADRAHRAGVTHASKGQPAQSVKQAASLAVGVRVLHLVDTSRSIQLPDGASAPRTLNTEVFYPAFRSPGEAGILNATPARAAGPFPLVIFGHGFAETPKLYAPLLHAWARAGYVVAAPLFPLENAGAPGGPDESDLVNQPADMRFVISRMLALNGSGTGPLAGLIDPAHIAVTGQSDGGDTALAVAYDGPYRDPRVSAAIILSGAEIPALPSFTFPPGGPPLLATQGTADTINPPSDTDAFFAAAGRPKYLLTLIGAEHLPPYSTNQRQLAIVEHVTVAFLAAYLKQRTSAVQSISSSGNVSGAATLQADP